MDRNERAVMAMHIRRLSDGDRAQYIQHFSEARLITVGKYQEYIERELDIFRGVGGAGKAAGKVAGLPSLNRNMDYDWGGRYISAAEMAAEMADALDDNLDINRNMYMDWTSHLLGRSDK